MHMLQFRTWKKRKKEKSRYRLNYLRQKSWINGGIGGAWDNSNKFSNDPRKTFRESAREGRIISNALAI